MWRFKMKQFVFFYSALLFLSFASSNEEKIEKIDCNNLRMGQYICPDPSKEFIDPKTQQPIGCTKENKAKGTFEYNSVKIILYKIIHYSIICTCTSINHLEFPFFYAAAY